MQNSLSASQMAEKGEANIRYDMPGSAFPEAATNITGGFQIPDLLREIPATPSFDPKQVSTRDTIF